MKMEIQGEFGCHQICDTCEGGRALVNAIESGNGTVRSDLEKAVGELTPNVDRSNMPPVLEEMFAAQQETLGDIIDRAVDEGTKRVVCDRNGPSRLLGRCGARAIGATEFRIV
jgi:hypothetical protein